MVYSKKKPNSSHTRLTKKPANTLVVKSVSFSYPPLDSPKGTAFLSQNRQFQWTNTGNVIYPIIPAYAATLLKSRGLKIFWDDAIAQKLSYKSWLTRLVKNQPDMVVIETKTPVIKRHWQIVKDIKSVSKKQKNWHPKIVLIGDHVTALPQESIDNCPLDYILSGGHYDLLLDELISKINSNNSPKDKVYQLQKPINLETLPIIDRKLTKWQLYANNNTNYKYKPGSYIMSGRDCWWGRCSFCLTGDTNIITKNNIDTIENIVNNKTSCEVLTNDLDFQKVIGWHKRQVDEDILNISTMYLPNSLRITGNHKVYYISNKSLHRCSEKNSWSYKCRPSIISKRIICKNCSNKYYTNYKISTTEAKYLEKGDYLAVPINRDIKNIDSISIEEIYKKQPTVLKTHKKISDEKIKEIIKLWNQKISERKISTILKIDWETVHRYITLKKNNQLNNSINHFSLTEGKIKYNKGQHLIPKNIEINNDFLFIAGLYLAEGHVSLHKNRPNSATIGFTFDINEKDLISKTKNYFKKYFNQVLSNTVNMENHTNQLSMGSTIIAKSFKILFGHNCYQKKIPQEFIYLPIEKQRYLLDGLFKGDGHIRRKEYIYETTSYVLANQVFSMLLRFNALPGFKIKIPKKTNESTKYKISLFQQDIVKVFPDIKLNSVSKTTYKKGFFLGNHAMVPIINIEKEHYKGDVYNLTIKKRHSFVANYYEVKNCSWTTLFPGKNFHSFSVKHTIAEIENLVNNFGVKEIFDDSGTLPVGKWLYDLCHQLIDRELNKKVVLGCNMRFGALTQQEYNLMKKAGFRFILYGLESANQKTLDFVNKNEKTADVLNTLKMAKIAKLEPHVTVIIGYPHETLKQTNKTLNLVRYIFKNNLADSLQATILIPYPGTPLFNYCQKNNLLLSTNWDDYDMRQPIIKSPISPQKQLKLVQNLFKGVITPNFIIKKITSIRSFSDLKHLSNYALKYFKKLKDFS